MKKWTVIGLNWEYRMLKPKTIQANLSEIKPLTDSILQLIIEPEQYIDYLAGQYLQIIHQQEYMSYSIANAPLGARHYELHLCHSPDNPYNQSLLEAIKQKGQVQLHLPLGDCHLAALDPERPILFLAAGTGFAPVNALIEQLLADADSRPFELFWGARSQSDLYMDEKVMVWQKHVSHFEYFSSLSGTDKGTLIDQVQARHGEGLEDWQIVLAGPFDMVYNYRDKLLALGLQAGQLYSDAFSFEEN